MVSIRFGDVPDDHIPYDYAFATQKELDKLRSDVGPAALAASPELKAAFRSVAETPMVSRIGGKRVLWLGDSISNGSQSTNASLQSFKAMAWKILGPARLAPEGTNGSSNGGVAGNTSAQALTRIDALLATSPAPQVMFVLIGTNDASQAVPLATFQANVTAIKAKADAARIPMAMGLVPPRGASNTAENALVRQYNAWLRFWCPLRGVPLADTFAALVDPTTGALSGTYNTLSSDGTGGAGDGTHPNNAGHLAMAQIIAPVLAPLCPPLLPWPLVANGGGLMTDPLGISGTYSVIAGPTTNAPQTIISRTDWPDMLAPSGRRIILDNTAGGSSTSTTLGRTTTTGYAAGDRLLVVGQLRGVGGTVPGKLQVMDNSNVVKAVLYESGPNATPGPMAFGYTVPAGGLTAVKIGHIITAAAGTTATIDIGGLDVYNLTALGLADYA